MHLTKCCAILVVWIAKHIIGENPLGNLQNQKVRFAANRTNVSEFNESLHRPQVRLHSVSGNRNHNSTALKLKVVSEENNQLVYSDYDDDWSFMISRTLWNFLNTKASNCNFMVATLDSDQPLVAEIIRLSFGSSVPIVILDMGSKVHIPANHLLRDAWVGNTFTCQTLVIDLLYDGDLRILRDLAEQKLWLWPNANVFMVGAGDKAKSATQHTALRNTIQPLYLGIDEKPRKNSLSTKTRFETWKSSQSFEKSTTTFPLPTAKEYVRLYIRCLYCNNGQPKTLLVLSWALGSELPEITLSNRKENFQGHHMRVISFPIEPFSSYVQSKDGPGGVVKLLDSFDKRLLEALSSGMNFTYNVRSPKDMQIGYRLKNGSWTGVVGVIHKNEADFTTLIGTAPERDEVMDLMITVYIDHMIIVSLKPQLLPHYLAFFRPFTENVWILLIFTVTTWGSTLWFLEKLRSSFSGQKGDDFNKDLFYSWAILLGNLTSGQSANSTRQMLVGWWLVGCFLISTFFKSSLVAHLTVQGKTREIDTCSDVVKRVDWTWGIEEKYLIGLLVVALELNVDPDVRYFFEHHEKISAEEGLKKVLRGRYSLLAGKDRALEIIGSKYTNIYGLNPFHLGKEQYKASNIIGWGFRKGAPFKERLSKAIKHLWESGISDRWLKEVRIANTKSKSGPTEEETELRMRAEANVLIVDSNIRVLQTKHMLGVYVVLISGLCIALLAFVGEKLSEKIFSDVETKCHVPLQMAERL